MSKVAEDGVPSSGGSDNYEVKIDHNTMTGGFDFDMPPDADTYKNDAPVEEPEVDANAAVLEYLKNNVDTKVGELNDTVQRLVEENAQLKQGIQTNQPPQDQGFKLPDGLEDNYKPEIVELFKAVKEINDLVKQTYGNQATLAQNQYVTNAVNHIKNYHTKITGEPEMSKEDISRLASIVAELKMDYSNPKALEIAYDSTFPQYVKRSKDRASSDEEARRRMNTVVSGAGIPRGKATQNNTPDFTEAGPIGAFRQAASHIANKYGG